ncbi:MAG: hypothetical protein HC896_04360 [Bacteroidales bacterium]|nr:hypothetical protein [Bacteroidales bacterium]
MMFTPNAKLEFTIIPRILQAMVSINGSINANHYQQVVQENQFIAPGSQVRHSATKLNLNAGIQGLVSKEISYRVTGNYKLTDKEHFYVIDTASPLHNHYTIEYDRLQQLSVTGHMAAKISHNIEGSLQATLVKNTVSNLDEAWHTPSFTAKGNVSYTFHDMFVASLQTSITGKRYAQSFYDTAFHTIELKPFTDINLKVEYLYNKSLSAFLSVYNLVGADYQLWYQYPSRRLMIMAGFVYSL